MERKRIIQIVIIVVALCGIGMIGMGCMWNFNAEQRKADEAGIDWYEYWPDLESIETF